MRAATTTCLILLLAVGALAQGEPAVDATQAAIAQAAKQIAEKLTAATEPKTGDVVEEDWNDIAHPTLYVAVGSKDGVAVDMLLDIIEKGEPIKGAGGEILGYREVPVGTARITNVQSDKLCTVRVETIVTGNRPGKGCIARTKVVPKCLAVTDIQNPDKKVSDLGKRLSAALAAALQATGKATAATPAQLDALLRDARATLADLASAGKSAELANDLVVGEDKTPIRGLVVGTVSQRETTYDVSVRVQDVGSTLSVGKAGAEMAKMTELDELYKVKLGAVLLFEELTPLEMTMKRKPLGVCPMGKKLFDDCYGYTNGYAIFDLKGTKWTFLRTTIGIHDTNPEYRDYGAMYITLDGEEVVKWENRPVDVNIPLTGLALRIEVKGSGAVAAGDFQLIAGE